jgi:hypothetical protein
MKTIITEELSKKLKEFNIFTEKLGSKISHSRGIINSWDCLLYNVLCHNKFPIVLEVGYIARDIYS